jgi:hypothetical protein
VTKKVVGVFVRFFFVRRFTQVLVFLVFGRNLLCVGAVARNFLEVPEWTLQCSVIVRPTQTPTLTSLAGILTSQCLHICMYVDFLHIGRIRMDIDNPGVTWDLDKPAGIQR